MNDGSRSELGDFLRSRREKLSPRSRGETDARRRRTPGLRREEVAELAGIGVDWYIRLEQGRTVSPSLATIEALGRALRLSKAEQAHLRVLARNPGRRAFERETVPPEIRRMLASLPQPAYVTGRRWDLLAWNEPAAALFGDFDQLADEERNILVYMLTTPGARRLFGAGWADEARRMVALFRATYDLWAGDAAFTGLLARLRRGCPELDAWWEGHDVAATRAGTKLFYRGRKSVRYEHITFQSNDDPALKLALYNAIGISSESPAARART